MGYVFVSYSSKDRPAVMRLAEALRAADYLPWVDHDPRSIPGGSLWRERIVEAIDNADTVLLALSPHAAKSDEVRTELDVAKELEKPIVPAELQATTLPPAMRYHLAGRQRINLASDWEAGVRRLLDALGALRQPTGGDDEATVDQEVEREGKKMLVAILNDPDPALDLSEKLRRFQVAYAAEASRRRRPVLARKQELFNRMMDLEQRGSATRKRITELRSKLLDLKRKNSEIGDSKRKKRQERKIWDTEQQIREAEKDHAEIASQHQEVSKLNREQVEKDLHESKARLERQRKLIDEARRQGNELIERIFRPKE